MHTHDQVHLSASDEGEVLRGLRLRGSSYCQSHLAAPWGLRVPPTPELAFYAFVVRGACVCRLGDEVVPMRAGDFLLLPRGEGHELCDAPATAALPIDALRWESVLNLCVVRVGGDGPETHLVTGSLDFEAHPLLEALPRCVSLRAGGKPGDAWLTRTIETMAEEATRPRAGTEVVLSRLAEVVAVGAIRRWLEDGEAASPGLLRGLADPGVRRALALIHQRPEDAWTLASLASAVGMSRTTFAERFAEHVGVSPIRYWTRWRMQVAAQWLREEQLSVDEAAARLGYSSAASFSRAFKGMIGASPGAVRRRGPSTRPPTLNERLSQRHSR